MAHNKTERLRTFHLFAGAGGGILADLLLGHIPVGACEIEEYPRAVLLQRQRDGILPEFPIWDDIKTLDGKPWRGLVDVVAGGFPCQDISSAGKGAGISGERSGLWGEMARIIDEIRPRYVFVENSPMLTSRGLGRVLGDLAKMGYNARWGVLGADDAGAPHRRKRIWIVADSMHSGHGELLQQEQELGGEIKTNTWGNGKIQSLADSEKLHVDVCKSDGEDGEPQASESGGGDCKGNVADPAGIGQQGSGKHGGRMYEATNRAWEADRAFYCGEGKKEQWLTEPALGRVAHGVAYRVDRLKAIGNGQVPQCASIAWKILNKEQ